MGKRFLQLSPIILIYLLLEYVALAGIGTALGQFNAGFQWIRVYLGLNLFAFTGIFYALYSLAKHEGRRTKTTNWLIGFAFSMFIVKIIFLLFVLLNQLGALLWPPLTAVLSQLTQLTFQPYNDWITKLGLLMVAFPFVWLLYGISFGKYRYRVIEKKLNFENLPKAFDGFRIVQISDIHSGTFDSVEKVAKGVELLRKQEADLIVFTGDMVNNHASEVVPYVHLFKSLQAKFGKISILGNHDYGDYKYWGNPSAKLKNMENLKALQAEMGFQLLLNDSIDLELAGEKIHIVGVENWGLPPFPQYGDLDKACEGLEPNSFKILLSHDPSHWDAQVLDHEQDFELTLSGHTHGMQFGIEIGKIKWSPVKYRYKRWAGLYQKAQKKLYVNRGFGFLGFPGRAGIWPEITVITLKSKK